MCGCVCVCVCVGMYVYVTTRFSQKIKIETKYKLHSYKGHYIRINITGKKKKADSNIQNQNLTMEFK